MDIADILASVNHKYRPDLTDVSNDPERQQDLQLLTRRWVSERGAPELLPFPTALMDRVMKRLRSESTWGRKIESIEERTASMHAGTSFALVVLQTELERFKFLIRSFLRTRIAKIDAYPIHVVQENESIARETPLSPLLSPSEAQYAQTHCALLERHYSASFLSAFPLKLRRLDDKAGAGGVSMVEGPDRDAAVAVRFLGRIQPRARLEEAALERDSNAITFLDSIDIVCGHAETPRARDETEDDVVGRSGPSRIREQKIRMERGDIWLMKWSNVKGLVLSNQCELL